MATKAMSAMTSVAESFAYQLRETVSRDLPELLMLSAKASPLTSRHLDEQIRL